MQTDITIGPPHFFDLFQPITPCSLNWNETFLHERLAPPIQYHIALRRAILVHPYNIGPPH
jgi:hypothetical protein